MKKVAGSTTTRYTFAGANVFAEYVNGAAPSSPTREYIYAGGQLVAMHEGSALRYYHADHLSVRVTTDTAGAKIAEQGHFPFGENWYSASTTTKFRFTSYERDTESLSDYAIFRTHISRLGRFNRPDPIAGTISDPQTLNRYAYVYGDPVNLSDPLGLCPPTRVDIPEDWCGRRGGGGGNPFGCEIDGISSPCSFGDRFGTGGGVVLCENNDCGGGWVTNPKTGKPIYVAFFAFAGGTTGYFDIQFVGRGVHEHLGALIGSSDWQAYVRTYGNYLILLQAQAVITKITEIGIVSTSQLGIDNGFVRGGNFNFALDPSLFIAGVTAGGGTRCTGVADGLHFTQVGSSYFVHLDTVSPWRYFPFGALAHFVVDVFYGNTVPVIRR